MPFHITAMRPVRFMRLVLHKAEQQGRRCRAAAFSSSRVRGCANALVQPGE
jgi:hypothetical protein